ncbi:hypothetical protein MRX96_010578 [Rhipicephalus microplus]
MCRQRVPAAKAGPRESWTWVSFLQPHRGFDRLALDDTASEGSDSDVEEYNAPARKA